MLYPLSYTRAGTWYEPGYELTAVRDVARMIVLT